MLRILIAAAALVVAYGSAAAQVVIEVPAAEVYVAPAPSYVYEYGYAYRPVPRTYRYYRDVDDADVVIVRPRYGVRCAAPYYWDGGRCVYVRY